MRNSKSGAPNESASRRKCGWRYLGVVPLVMVGLVLGACEAISGPTLEPVRSMVAIEVPGGSLSRVGPVEVESGSTIQLRAVLEGIEEQETVYYTNAERLEVDGVEIPSTALRPWPDVPVRCLWQTLQVSAPYVKVSSEEQLDKLSFVNFSHPDWGLGCSAIATITARQRETLTVPDDAKRLAFGNQNYQVWVEILANEGDLVAAQSVRSAGSSELLSQPQSFPRGHMKLSGNLGPGADVFGLSQLEAMEEANEDARARITELHRQGLFFSRQILLQELLTKAASDVDGQLIELDDGRDFLSQDSPLVVSGERRSGVVAGDLLRVGDRFVVLFRDVGKQGVLDGADLCFDYERGALVRRLADVFTGEGDVEWIPREHGA